MSERHGYLRIEEMREGVDLGLALLRFRVRGRIRQGDVARTLGVSQSQVSRWESGRDKPRAHNIEAITALIWGKANAEAAALSAFVKGAQAPLVLVDDCLRIIAASAFLRTRGGPLALFGWLFDPEINPALPGLSASFRVLAKTEPVVMLAIPFSHEDRPWACRARITMASIGPALYGLGEVSFIRDTHQAVRDIALGPVGA